MGNDSDETRDWRTRRHRTAIARSALSMPARHAVLDGVVREDFRVLDYGCGRGHDVHHLKTMGIDAQGWDPVFAPMPRLRPTMRSFSRTYLT